MSEPPAVRPRVQRIARVAAVVMLALGPLVVRVAWEAHSELTAAAVAREAGDEATEVMHLGRALCWRLPMASHDEQAIARLLAIAEQAQGEVPVAVARALVAYREIRSALLGSRALDVPHADTLLEVDTRIAALMADGDAAAEATRLAELRLAPTHPRIGAMAAALAWVGWVLASARLLLRGIDARGRLVPGVGTRTGLLALALLIAWMVLWRFA